MQVADVKASLSEAHVLHLIRQLNKSVDSPFYEMTDRQYVMRDTP